MRPETRVGHDGAPRENDSALAPLTMEEKLTIWREKRQKEERASLKGRARARRSDGSHGVRESVRQSSRSRSLGSATSGATLSRARLSRELLGEKSTSGSSRPRPTTAPEKGQRIGRGRSLCQRSILSDVEKLKKPFSGTAPAKTVRAKAGNLALKPCHDSLQPRVANKTITKGSNKQSTRHDGEHENTNPNRLSHWQDAETKDFTEKKKEKQNMYDGTEAGQLVAMISEEELVLKTTLLPDCGPSGRMSPTSVNRLVEDTEQKHARECIDSAPLLEPQLGLVSSHESINGGAAGSGVGTNDCNGEGHMPAKSLLSALCFHDFDDEASSSTKSSDSCQKMSRWKRGRRRRDTILPTSRPIDEQDVKETHLVERTEEAVIDPTQASSALLVNTNEHGMTVGVVSQENKVEDVSCEGSTRDTCGQQVGQSDSLEAGESQALCDTCARLQTLCMRYRDEHIAVATLTGILRMEKQDLEERLGALGAAFEEKMEDHRNVSKEMSVLRRKVSQLQKEKNGAESRMEKMVIDLKEQMMTGLAAAVTKTHLLQQKLDACQVEKQILDKKLGQAQV